MDDTFLVILLLAAAGGVGYLIWKQNQASQGGGVPNPLANQATSTTSWGGPSGTDTFTVQTAWGNIQVCTGKTPVTAPPTCANPMVVGQECYNPTTQTMWWGPAPANYNTTGFYSYAGGKTWHPPGTVGNPARPAQDQGVNPVGWLSMANECPMEVAV